MLLIIPLNPTETELIESRKGSFENGMSGKTRLITPAFGGRNVGTGKAKQNGAVDDPISPEAPKVRMAQGG